MAYTLGILAGLVVFYLWSQSSGHNQPSDQARTQMGCGYCPWPIKIGQKMVRGHAGWGHVECVPKVRRRLFYRW